MTTININPSQSFGAQSLGFDRTGTAFIRAAGMMGRMMNPLGAGPFASASFPAGWLARAFSDAQPEPQQQWQVTTGDSGDGRASIDLGDGYKLGLNENNSEITITNGKTGETTRVWGDPHVEVDGKQAFDFWGTTTFTLDNGTKITINTEQGKDNPDVYFASSIAITKGDQAITVDGISQQELGDLSITTGGNARQIDRANGDGFVLNENASGAGWRSGYTGHIATQADLNLTKPGEAFGPDSNVFEQTLAGLGMALSSFLGNYASFITAIEGGGADRDRSDALPNRLANHLLV